MSEIDWNERAQQLHRRIAAVLSERDREIVAKYLAEVYREGAKTVAVPVSGEIREIVGLPTGRAWVIA